VSCFNYEVIIMSGGERGPKPLPANVHLLRGNASKKPLASLLDDVVRPDVEIPECPAHLEAEARVEWGRITPHLEKLGLISQIDRAALTGYCVAWGRHVEAETKIKAVGDSGLVETTPSGYKQISVWLQISHRSLDQMAKFLAMFGMSPSDRSRVTASDPQLPLEGMEPPKIGGWGTFQ
jgi:P27 family predicted phage terminase small subunit